MPDVGQDGTPFYIRTGCRRQFVMWTHGKPSPALWEVHMEDAQCQGAVAGERASFVCAVCTRSNLSFLEQLFEHVTALSIWK